MNLILWERIFHLYPSVLRDTGIHDLGDTGVLLRWPYEDIYIDMESVCAGVPGYTMAVLKVACFDDGTPTLHPTVPFWHIWCCYVLSRSN